MPPQIPRARSGVKGDHRLAWPPSAPHATLPLVAQSHLPQEPLALYRRLLDEGARVELIDGEVVVHAAPGMLHGFGVAGLSSDLYQGYQRGRGGPGGWWILIEVDVELAPTLQAYRPDIAGWRRERLQRMPVERPVRVTPDFVCEVLSPTNARWDRTQKKEGYERAGVQRYWLLDPGARTLEAYELFEGSYRIAGNIAANGSGRLPPFDAALLAMRELFPIDGP